MDVVYLIHFDRPIGDPDNPRGQAQHYMGATDDLERRLEEHRSGNGSAIMRAVAQAGIGWTVAKTWECRSHDHAFRKERQLKSRHKHRAFCPLCNREEVEDALPR